MSILNDLTQLLEAEVITNETAEKIRQYYQGKESRSNSRLYIAFGIVGALLTGLGIILIIAHNWDELTRFTKSFLAFLPLIIGQVLCGFSLLNKKESIAWKESSASFLFCAVGASISLISQIYNIPGNLSGFLLTWMLLCLPVIYLMRSSVVSLLYIIGITFYAIENSSFSTRNSEEYIYWLLFLVALPHYIYLYLNKPHSNSIIFHHWIIPLSLLLTLSTIADKAEELLLPAYMCLFGLFYLIGKTEFFRQQKLRNNSYLIISSLGTMSLLLFSSFSFYWESIKAKNFIIQQVITSPEFIACLILLMLACSILYLQKRKRFKLEFNPLEIVFILFLVIFIIGMFNSVAMVLVNILILVIGILTIRNGASHHHLGVLNYGLLIIAALVVCRFFDTEITFVVRGILLVIVGLGFFGFNYWMLKYRRTHE